MQLETDARRPVVVVAIKGLGIGGAEKLVSEAARFWDRTSFDYRVVYLLAHKNQLVQEIEALGIPVRCIGSKSGLSPAIAWRFRRLLAEWHADLVHAHLPVAGILARITSRIPVVYTEHNLAWSYRPFTRAINRSTYRLNAAVTAVSEAVAETIADYPGPRLKVVNNGVTVNVDPLSRSTSRLELGLNDSDSMVVHVGNIRPGKGHDVLIDVAALLKDRGTEATIVSVGGEKNPGDLSRLQQRVSEAGLNGRMRFLGRRPDALSLIAAADVYVNPAEFEGLPVTVLEAMALGRPVVATAVGGVPQIVRNGLTGTTVAPGRPDLLADALEEALRSPVEAQRMAAAGALLVAEEYGLEAMVRAFEGIYRQVLA